MHIGEYKNIYDHEETHFFYVANHSIILSLLEKYLNIKKSQRIKKKELKILDIGCGTGLLTKKLERFGDVVGIDYSDEALNFAKKRGITVKKGSITKLPFKDKSFDVAVCIDVLTDMSIHNDATALSEIFRILKPGSIAIIRLSANKWLRLNHDKHVHIRERYTKSELKKKIEKSGFLIEKISYVNMPLLPLAAIRYFSELILKPKETNSAVTTVPNILNKFASIVLSSESYLLKITDLPFGIGLIAVCRKPDQD